MCCLSFQTNANATKPPEVIILDTFNRMQSELMMRKAELVANPAKNTEFVYNVFEPTIDWKRFSNNIFCYTVKIVKVKVGDKIKRKRIRNPACKVWARSSKNQKKAFIKEFKKESIKTYAKLVFKSEGWQIRLKPTVKSKKNIKRVTVKSELFNPGVTTSIPISYNMYLSDHWKVYNVTANGLSMVKTYRAMYTKKIKAGGIEALTNELRVKNP
ncbi:MAG: ABC transporter substrate-binding protein [Methylococcales bacterium]|nr:ABC transporter substrate-binding protein [Methylococcales bacterium]